MGVGRVSLHAHAARTQQQVRQRVDACTTAAVGSKKRCFADPWRHRQRGTSNAAERVVRLVFLLLLLVLTV